MKQFLKKPLGLAVAATIAVGSMATFSTASARTDASALGDAAIIPYYTVKGNFVTGVQIINTSNETVAAKVRLRRDSDSADVLDFVIVFSPHDVWSGYIDDSGDGRLKFATSDKSCTVPGNSGEFLAPTNAEGGHLTGAEEGYIEIIGMGQVRAGSIAAAAKHTNGNPANCKAIQDSFLEAAVTSGDTTGNTTWDDLASDALKVSYFIRDASSGMEFGGNATHLKDFSFVPMMANQEGGKGLSSGGTNGFDFPDLDGGGSKSAPVAATVIPVAPALVTGTAAARGTVYGSYNSVVRADLGASSILNNWSYNTANNVSTDWVVTIPGQYLMKHPKTSVSSTDLPVTAVLTMYDREETEAKGGQVVVSPGAGLATTLFKNEVNVIEWGGKSLFNSDASNIITADPERSGITSQFGWASLTLTADSSKVQRIYDLTGGVGSVATAIAVRDAAIAATILANTAATNATNTATNANTANTDAITAVTNTTLAVTATADADAKAADAKAAVVAADPAAPAATADQIATAADDAKAAADIAATAGAAAGAAVASVTTATAELAATAATAATAVTAAVADAVADAVAVALAEVAADAIVATATAAAAAAVTANAAANAAATVAVATATAAVATADLADIANLAATDAKTLEDEAREAANVVATTSFIIPLATSRVPVIGFVAWQRTFNSAEKNYGRLIEHSRKQ